MGTKQFSNYESLITFSRASKGHALRPVSYGDELLTNGTFDTDSDWTLDTGWAISNGELVASSASTGNAAYQNFTTVVGKTYIASVDCSAITQGTFRLYWRVVGGAFQTYSDIVAGGTTTLTFVATSTSTRINVYALGTSSGVFDNVSVKEVTFDQPDGTLTLFEHPENVPRVEYDSDGNRLGLLVEEQRTNLTTISEPTASELSNSTNVSDGDFNNSLGLSNGIKFDDNSATRFAYRSATVSSGQDYTVSVFVKMDDGSTPSVGSNTTSGDFGLVVGSSLITSGSDISITAMSDNVFRVSGTRTTTSTDNNHGVIKYTGQSTKGFTVTGFQIEQASFPTSYIKTTGSTATRSADVASIPVADFGYNASNVGTLFCHISGMSYEDGGTGYPVVLRFDNASNANDRRGFFVSEGSNFLRSEVLSNSVGQAGLTVATASGGSLGDTKMVFAMAENDFAVSGNGGTVNTDTSGTVASGLPITTLGTALGDRLNGHIKSIKYYPRRLTNAQLVDLTS